MFIPPYSRPWSWLAAVMSILIVVEIPTAPAQQIPALDTDEALKSIRLKPGFAIELVASEPLIEDPVAIDFAPDGRLWVCEMHDYPLGLDGQYKPGGRIKILEDTDQDGRYDKATLFLEGIPFPTGVLVWRRGALICAAPQVIYAEDTDGDGKADRREVVCEGFGTGNYQSRVNSLYLALDNWLYGASGLNGERVTMRASGEVVDVGSRDFRLDLDMSRLEPASGRTQYGRTRDDWDNHFGNTNSSLLQHYPFPEEAASRNPFVAPPAPYVFVPRDPNNDRLYPASRTLARYNDIHAANRVTSACGTTIYRDELLGPEFTRNAFMCEPVHNLVTRLILEPDGVSFAGHRAEDEKQSEFLASTDNWFRPAQVRTGPDGALYVVDMYRFVIEHPRWISPGTLAKLDVRAGSDKGRIYRVYRSEYPPREVPALAGLETKGLVATLESPNGIVRDMVQRLLLERRDTAAAGPLQDLASRSERPEVRAQAMSILAGIGSLRPEIVLERMSDPHEGVRAQAARWAGGMTEDDPRFGPALVRLAADPAITVRFQTAISLAAYDDAEVGQALGCIAMSDPDDAWIRAAVLSAATRHPASLLQAVLKIASQRRLPPPGELVGPIVATTAGTGDPDDLAKAIDTLTQSEPESGERIASWRLTALSELLSARRVAGDEALKASLTNRLGTILDAIRRMAGDDSVPEADRAKAIDVMGLVAAGADGDIELFSELVSARQPAVVAAAAIKAIDRRAGSEAVKPLLSKLPELGPTVRSALLDTLLARREGIAALLDAMEQHEIVSTDLSAAARQRMLMTRDEALREQAARILQGASQPERLQVVENYQERIESLEGDVNRGSAIFEKLCATCHVFAGVGKEVGPDLAELTDRSLEALLIAILDPNRDVDGRYVAYNAAMTDGRVLNGLIAAESGSALTLRAQDGKEDVILRNELEELRSTGLSLMPEGLEKDLSPTDLADLIAHIASGGLRPKVLAGNAPRIIQQAEDGTIFLPAEAAEIYGDTLTFETQFGNLGYWQSPNDRAAWTFVVDRPGIYNVSMEWACPHENAGGAFLVKIDKGTRRNLVSPTDSWSSYDTIFIDEERFTPGTHRLELFPDPSSPLSGPLFDIKSVTVSPIR